MGNAADDEILAWSGVDFDTDLKRGSRITVKPKKITCHHLPIGGGA